MSIKEYIRRTAENERDNIRDIKIEKDRKRELPFDQEIEITESDWQEIEKDLKQLYVQTRLSDLLEGAVAMKLLRPESIEKWVNNAYPEMEQFLKECRRDLVDIETSSRFLYNAFFEKAAEIKIMWPDRFDVNKLDRQEALETLKDFYNHNDWYLFAKIAMNMKILWPGKVHDLMLEERAWQEMQMRLEHYEAANDWYDFMLFASWIKILFPARRLNLSDRRWEKMKATFKDYYKNKQWWVLARQALALSILAAYKVEVTKEGLEITMRNPAEKYREQHEPRPVRLSPSL